MVRPFSASFRFGWSGVEAARASASLKVHAGRVIVSVKGGTYGMARTLWRLDATHESVFLLQNLKPQGFVQTEQYSNRLIKTQAVFKSDALWRLRERTPDGGPSKWKRVEIAPIRDIVSAMFFVRSQALANGDSIRLIAYPGDSPFLVEVKVLRREPVKIRGVSRNAIRMEIRLQRIEDGKTPTLQKHTKFRTGTVWISDDADRFPLRAEVDIFVGAIFAELQEVKYLKNP